MYELDSIILIPMFVTLFQTLLRIWDCFLLDGLRIIFQFSVALLRYYEQCLLDKKDILAFLKDAKMLAKQTYDVEGLVDVSSLSIFYGFIELLLTQIFRQEIHPGFLEGCQDACIVDL